MKKQFIKSPFLSTAFSESGKRAKKRLESLFTKRAGRRGAGIAAALISILMMSTLISCQQKAEPSKPLPSYGESDAMTMTMDEAVGAAILKNNDGGYAACEFYGEGHIILDSETEGNEVKIYAVTSYGGYTFMNGMFIKDAGTGAIPAVVTLKINGDGGYEPKNVEYPKDGNKYAESIRDMFPLLIAERVLREDFYPRLISQERAQAEEYLKSIGREAIVGEYSDLNAVLPDMNTEASNTLLNMDKYDDGWRYPMFIGNCEYLEDGKRVIYETDWDGNKEGGTMTYTKYDESGTVLDRHVFMIQGEAVRKGVNARVRSSEK